MRKIVKTRTPKPRTDTYTSYILFDIRLSLVLILGISFSELTG